MNALHDDHISAGSGIVEPCRQGFIPPSERCLANRFALRFTHIVRIVDHDDVAALPGEGAIHRSRKPVTAGVVFETNLRVLVGRQPEPLTPGHLVERRFNQTATSDAVPDRQGVRIGRE
jgi:hypothetical protein